MMQYMMLLLYKQMHYGHSLGSIFDLLSSQTEEDNITRYLLEIFWEIVNGIGEILKVDCMELFEEIIRGNQRAEEIMKLFAPVFEKKPAAWDVNALAMRCIPGIKRVFYDENKDHNWLIYNNLDTRKL